MLPTNAFNGSHTEKPVGLLRSTCARMIGGPPNPHPAIFGAFQSPHQGDVPNVGQHEWSEGGVEFVAAEVINNTPPALGACEKKPPLSLLL